MTDLFQNGPETDESKALLAVGIVFVFVIILAICSHFLKRRVRTMEELLEPYEQHLYLSDEDLEKALKVSESNCCFFISNIHIEKI
jgi:hypothetical protein